MIRMLCQTARYPSWTKRGQHGALTRYTQKLQRTLLSRNDNKQRVSYHGAEVTQQVHIPHRDKGIAYHIDWDFRKEAMVRSRGQPIRPNFHPLGGELKNWLIRRGQLRILYAHEKIPGQSFTNPYTCNASALSIAYAEIVNDCADFADSTESLDSVAAQIKFMRLQTESILYPARLCEAFVKQLLYLTSFKEKDYRGVSLRGLLSKDCTGCRSSNGVPHEFSLLGSLAHRYRLCHEFEDCLKDHLRLINRRRNTGAAHSGIPNFSRKSSATLRKNFGDEFIKHGKLFRHMLEHVSEIEDRIFSELCTKIAADLKAQKIPKTEQ